MAGCGIIQSVTCLVIGCLSMIILIVCQIHLQAVIKPDPSGKWFTGRQTIFFVASRTFVFVSICVDTLIWKGFWEILDFTGALEDVWPNIILFIGVTLILAGFQSLNACHSSALGLGLNVDISSEFLSIDTALKKTSSGSAWVRLLDGFFTVVLNLASVIVCRCMWTLIDKIWENTGWQLVFITPFKISHHF
jgi:Fuseless